MGYTTDFEGSWTITPPLQPAHRAYLKAFAETRRMARNATLTAARPDPLRAAVGLPVGGQGAYFVSAEEYAGQEHTPDVLDFNSPPEGQPGLWCQWVPTDDGTALVWDEGEKFYNYVEWLRYLIAHFLRPWGYTLNGEVSWQGEDPEDAGVIYVTNNAVQVRVYTRVLTPQEEESE